MLPSKRAMTALAIMSSMGVTTPLPPPPKKKSNSQIIDAIRLKDRKVQSAEKKRIRKQEKRIKDARSQNG